MEPFVSQQYWEDKWHEDKSTQQQHVEWLCSYHTLSPILQPWCKARPRCSALVIGSGLSTFPEELYDSGVREVVMLDLCSSAVQAVQARNLDESAARRGLRCITADLRQTGLIIPAPPTASTITSRVTAQPTSSVFDLVVDKGTLDCILSAKDGRAQALTAVHNMYALLKTPGMLLLVSHSPPADRLDVLQQVYWHDTQVKQVKCTSWSKLSTSEYAEQLLDLEHSTSPAFELGTAYVYILTK